MHPTRTALVLILSIAVALALFLAHFEGATTWLRGPDASKLVVLTQPPDFDWQPGSKMRASAGPNGTVLVFVASTCPCSNVYADRFLALVQSYQTQFHFLWINEDKVRLLDKHPTQPLQHTLERLQQSGSRVDSLFDAHDTLARQYGVKVTPDVLVLDHAGYIHYHGRVDNDQILSKVTTHELRDALQAMLDGRDVMVKEAPAVGCFIDDGS